ncbi:MAG: hypothetical protein HQL38_08110 [Alphaproteobacteria bacterium]|nr:hypothetical protein [Alphaproteobacteria bacterium]MBF0392632.1 hypothetical protein [Alphaproteobacteria bacterium]
MNDEFSIEFEPIARDHGSELERATLAEIGISIGARSITRLEDALTHTVRDRARLSIVKLAAWFAENWWRLRWEPEADRPGTSWLQSHTLAAAGGGYLWPNVTFASDGNFVRVRALPTPECANQHIRYLSLLDEMIPAESFESAVDTFVEGALARIADSGVDAGALGTLWSELRTERGDPEAGDLRRIEALLGFDPDEAPEGLLAFLRQTEVAFGAASTAEVAAFSRHERVLKDIEALEACRAGEGSSVVTMPPLPLDGRPEEAPALPWERGERLARAVRRAWSLGDAPLSNARLFDLLGSKDILKWREAPFGAGFRIAERPGSFAVNCHARYESGRRFELARLIGDQITASPDDHLLPATGAKTARQKFQRSFATEFLCPYDQLQGEIGDRGPSDDDIERLAERYEVSSLLVRTSFVNKGDLPRDALVA